MIEKIDQVIGSHKKLILGGLLLIAIGFQLAAALQKSFWEDEAFTATVAQQDLSDVVVTVTKDVHPPLYLVVISSWEKIFGSSELALRMFSILCVILTLLLTYKLTVEILDDRAGIVVMVLLSLSPLYIMFGHNARYYALAAALSMMVTLSLLLYLRTNHIGYLLIYTLSGAVILYIVYASFSVLLACNLWWLWIKLKKRTRSATVQWLIAQGVIILLHLPWLILMNPLLKTYAGGIQYYPGLIGDVLLRGLYLGFTFAVGETLSPLNPLTWVALGIVIILSVAAIRYGKKAPDLWMMLVFLFTISIANLMISLNATVSQTWQNLPYRTLYAFPYLAIWLTAGFMALKKPAYLLSIILVGVYSVGIYNYFTGKQFIQPIYTVPWREIFSSITAVSTPDTLVICSHGDFACPYYTQRYGFGSHTAEDWVNLSGQTYSQVWWIQSNLGASLQIYVNETEIFQEIRNRYKDSIEYHFAPQDPTIRWIKTTLLNRDDYEYRVDVYRFGQPIQR